MYRQITRICLGAMTSNAEYQSLEKEIVGFWDIVSDYFTIK